MITDGDLTRLLGEDLPYGDLTTELLGIEERGGSLTFLSREESVASCAREAGRIFEICGARTEFYAKEGSLIQPGERFLRVSGSAGAIHRAWKSAQTILEYAGAIATRTHRMVESIQREGLTTPVMGTRKTFPGGRQIAAKALKAGGGNSHRLGLSETVLVFEAHRVFLEPGALEGGLLLDMKRRAPEKKIVVEISDEGDLVLAAKAGADILQIDKCSPEKAKALIDRGRGEFPHLQFGVAGGINGENAGTYAKTGADFLVSSWMYAGKAIDIKSDFRRDDS